MKIEVPISTQEAFKNGVTRVYELRNGDIVYLSSDIRIPILGEINDNLKCVEVVDRWTDGYIKQFFKWIRNEWMLHFSKHKELFYHKSFVFCKPVHFVGGNYMYIESEEINNV